MKETDRNYIWNKELCLMGFFSYKVTSRFQMKLKCIILLSKMPVK